MTNLIDFRMPHAQRLHTTKIFNWKKIKITTFTEFFFVNLPDYQGLRRS